MKNKIIHFVFLPVIISFLLFPLISSANDFPAGKIDTLNSSRDQLIQKKMGCLATTDKQKWDELCSLSSHESQQQERQDIIAKALDLAENVPVDTTPVINHITPPEDLKPQSDLKQTKKAYTEDVSNNIQLKTHSMDFGTELYRYSYKEPIFNLEIKGIQYGIWGNHTYRPKEGDGLRSNVLNMYKIDARFSFGSVDYHSDGSGQLKNEDNFAFEFRGIAGYDYLFNDQFLLTSYTGFGFRYLNNDSSGRQSTTGDSGYERVSNYFYLPIGVETLNQITPNWKINSNLEWDIFLAGKQTSYLSDVDSGYPDIENRQKRGYGIRGSLKLIKDGEHFNLFLEPFFRYWKIQDSDLTTAVGNDFIVTGFEPANNTTEYGIKLGFQY